MVQLSDYAKERIDEGAIIKAIKKIWGWLTGKSDKNKSIFFSDVDTKSEGSAVKVEKTDKGDKKIKINYNLLQYQNIKTKNLLAKYIYTSNPNEKTKSGFYTTEKLLKEYPEFNNLKSKPYKPVFYSIEDSVHNQYALVCYNCNYIDTKNLILYNIDILKSFKHTTLFENIIDYYTKFSMKNKLSKLTIVVNNLDTKILENLGFSNDDHNVINDKLKSMSKTI